MNSKQMFLLCMVVGSFAMAYGKDLKIEGMEHDIQLINPQNFDGVISKFRDSAVSSLWYFNADKKEDKDFLDEYNKLAGDLKGMMKVTALDCTEFKKFCEKNGVKDTPHVQIFPTNPIPPFRFEGKLEAKAIASKMSKFIMDMSTKVTKDNIDSFATSDPTKPKVFLFSNKKSAPTMWKALSSETVFRRSIKFGFVSEDEKDVLQKYKVTKFPTIIMQRGSKAEIKETYKGDVTFQALSTWVNLHSESGMGDKVAGSGGKEEVSIEEAKPWLVQEVPELTGKSQQDICFKGEGLCVIYLKEGSLSPGAETDMLTDLSKKFTSQLSDRGAKMKWMWLDLAAEPEYKKLFAPTQLPSAVVFNPHKRLRFAAMDHGEDGEVKGDAEGLTKLMDKVLGGDARFKMVPGQKLPSWAKREGKKEL